MTLLQVLKILSIKHFYLFICFLVLSFFISCKQKEAQQEYTPLQKALKDHQHDEGFVGSKKCVSCHTTAYEQWEGSDHQLAMQLPSDSSVLGDFNNSKYTIYGITSTFYKKDSLFYINTEGPDGKYHDYEVKYTFGHDPLQQYLVEFPNGKLQVVTPFWDTRPKEKGGQKWQHLYPDEFIASHDQLHWGRQMQNWNFMCAECHSTNVKKNYDAFNKKYNTQFDEINVSCEACHGPGDIHAAWAENGSKEKLDNLGFVFDIIDRDTAHWNIDSKTGKIKRSSERKNKMQVEWCGRCHSRRTQLTDKYTYGKVLEHTHQLSYLDYPLYNDDGTNNDEVYVYGSFVQSKMYKKGVLCKDCHNVHSGKLKAPGNNVCFQCHLPELYNTTTHHKHDITGEGGSCINCHMPKQTLMVVDPRSDHSLRIPRPDISVKTGATNACNNCHKDKSNQWALKNFKKWYGNKYDTIPHYGFAFNAVRTNKAHAQIELNKVISDKNTPKLVLGTAIRMQDYNNNPQAFENLKNSLNSSSPIVRRAGLESMQSFPKELQWQLAKPLLEDPVYGVRFLANSLLYDTPTESLSPSDIQLIEKAKKEFLNQLLFWEDRSSGLTSLGNAQMKLGDLNQAEYYFKQAIENDSLDLFARVNFADLHRIKGDNSKSIEILKKVITIDKKFAVAYQALAFAYIRNGEKEKALIEFKNATVAMPENAQYFYYYTLALNDLGKTKLAISTLKKALIRHKNDEQLLYLAYTIFKDTGNPNKAITYLKKLVKLYPNNQQYKQLENSF